MKKERLFSPVPPRQAVPQLLRPPLQSDPAPSARVFALPAALGKEKFRKVLNLYRCFLRQKLKVSHFFPFLLKTWKHQVCGSTDHQLKIIYTDQQKWFHVDRAMQSHVLEMNPLRWSETLHLKAKDGRAAPGSGAWPGFTGRVASGLIIFLSEMYLLLPSLYLELLFFIRLCSVHIMLRLKPR